MNYVIMNINVYCGVSGFSWSFTRGLGDEGNPKVILPQKCACERWHPKPQPGAGSRFVFTGIRGLATSVATWLRVDLPGCPLERCMWM